MFDEVLDELLPGFCSVCGLKLSRPGTQCSCGVLPSLLREEASEILSAPGSMSQYQAKKAVEDAEQALEVFMEKTKAPDKWNALAGVEIAGNEIDVQLAAADVKVKTLTAKFGRAKSAATKARKSLTDAERVHGDAVTGLEKAVRVNAGPEAEAAAQDQVDARVKILARYQAAYDEASAALIHAETELTRARMVLQECQEASALACEIRDGLADIPCSEDRVKLLARPLLSIAAELTDLPPGQYEDVQEAREVLAGVTFVLAAALGIKVDSPPLVTGTGARYADASVNELSFPPGFTGNYFNGHGHLAGV